MELYSCSSSIGTTGRSWAAMRRPLADVADSRFAIDGVLISRRVQWSGGNVAQIVVVTIQQWGRFRVGVTFRNNAY